MGAHNKEDKDHRLSSFNLKNREIKKIQFSCKSRYKSTRNLAGHLYQICFHIQIRKTTYGLNMGKTT